MSYGKLRDPLSYSSDKQSDNIAIYQFFTLLCFLEFGIIARFTVLKTNLLIALSHLSVHYWTESLMSLRTHTIGRFEIYK